jgi:hypothetical protein
MLANNRHHRLHRRRQASRHHRLTAVAAATGAEYATAIQGRIPKRKLSSTRDPCSKLHQVRSEEQLVRRDHHYITIHRRKLLPCGLGQENLERATMPDSTTLTPHVPTVKHCGIRCWLIVIRDLAQMIAILNHEFAAEAVLVISNLCHDKLLISDSPLIGLQKHIETLPMRRQ